MRCCEHLKEAAVHLAGSSNVAFQDSPRLPLPHASALALVVRLSERCRAADGGDGGGGGGDAFSRGVPTGLRSCIKYCVKKNGLGRAAGEVRLPRVVVQCVVRSRRCQRRVDFEVGALSRVSTAVDGCRRGDRRRGLLLPWMAAMAFASHGGHSYRGLFAGGYFLVLSTTMERLRRYLSSLKARASRERHACSPVQTPIAPDQNRALRPRSVPSCVPRREALGEVALSCTPGLSRGLVWSASLRALHTVTGNGVVYSRTGHDAVEASDH